MGKSASRPRSTGQQETYFLDRVVWLVETTGLDGSRPRHTDNAVHIEGSPAKLIYQPDFATVLGSITLYCRRLKVLRLELLYDEEEERPAEGLPQACANLLETAFQALALLQHLGLCANGGGFEANVGDYLCLVVPQVPRLRISNEIVLDWDVVHLKNLILTHCPHLESQILGSID